LRFVAFRACERAPEHAKTVLVELPEIDLPLGRTPVERKRAPGSSRPASISVSRSMKYGLPANAENDWYGESPYPVGPSGSTCQ
jgi:hypothetical protein